jgi:hypothetical protein
MRFAFPPRFFLSLLTSFTVGFTAVLGPLHTYAQGPAFAPAPVGAIAPTAGAGSAGIGGSGVSLTNPTQQSGGVASNLLRSDTGVGIGSRSSAQGLIEAATARASGQGDADADNSLLAFRDISADSTEFQQFVAASTGRKLPLFGYNLFAGSRFSSLKNVPVPSDYIIGPGDEIVMQVYGLLDADARLTVDRNGQISVPKVGTFRLAGTKLPNSRQYFAARLVKPTPTTSLAPHWASCVPCKFLS